MHTDRQLVADEYYGTTRILRARQRLFDFQRPRFDLHDDVASVVATAPGPVIDVGCGNGLLRARLAARRPDLDLFGVDVSTGMAPDVVGDVQAFPVADGAATITLDHLTRFRPPPGTEPRRGAVLMLFGDGPAGPDLLLTDLVKRLPLSVLEPLDLPLPTNSTEPVTSSPFTKDTTESVVCSCMVFPT